MKHSLLHFPLVLIYRVCLAGSIVEDFYQVSTQGTKTLDDTGEGNLFRTSYLYGNSFFD